MAAQKLETLEDFLDASFGGMAAEPTFQTVVHNILEEPIAEDTKRGFWPRFGLVITYQSHHDHRQEN